MLGLRSRVLLTLGIAASIACAGATSSTSPAKPTPVEAGDVSGVSRDEATSRPDEISVRPGINDPYFRNDALERYTDILEAESREVVKQRDAIVEAMGLREGMSVADIGAGTGLFTNAIAESVGETGQVFAVDIVPEFLARVRVHAEEAGLAHVTTVLGEERATNLPPQSVDLAFMCDTYHHVEYPQNYLRSLYQTLRPGGVLLLIDFERIQGETRPAILRHVRAGKDTVIEEVTDAGFILDAEIDLLEENYYLRFLRHE